MADPADPFLQDLRRADPDRYLSILYAPAEKRPALAALYAFDAEVAAVRSRVSEALPGEIRLQWWRDALTAPEPALAVAGNPLGEALASAMADYRLPPAAFARHIDARIFDLYDDAMPDRTALEAYAGETVSLLFQMAAQILNDGDDPRCADAAGHAGVALCIARLMAAMPFWLKRGQMYVPADILDAAGITADALRQGGEGAARVVAAMAALGREHLDKAETHVAALDTRLKPAFLPLATAGVFLDKARAGGSKTVSEGIRLSPLRRQWLMLRRAAAISR